MESILLSDKGIIWSFSPYRKAKVAHRYTPLWNRPGWYSACFPCREVNKVNLREAPEDTFACPHCAARELGVIKEGQTETAICGMTVETLIRGAN